MPVGSSGARGHCSYKWDWAHSATDLPRLATWICDPPESADSGGFLYCFAVKQTQSLCSGYADFDCVYSPGKTWSACWSFWQGNKGYVRWLFMDPEDSSPSCSNCSIKFVESLICFAGIVRFKLHKMANNKRLDVVWWADSAASQTSQLQFLNCANPIFCGNLVMGSPAVQQPRWRTYRQAGKLTSNLCFHTSH